MPRVGVIAGLKEEVASLNPIMASEYAPVFRLSGARPRLAVSGVQALIDLGVSGLVSFGTAGALSPKLKAGDMIVGSSVVAADGTKLQCDPDWVSAVSESLQVDPVDVLGSEAMLGKNAKAQFHDRLGADAVDMESLSAARRASETGLPFLVLRSIIDPVDLDLPDFLLDSVRPDGSVSLLPVVAGMCLQPWKIGVLSSLGQNRKLALQNLRGAARVLGPGLGLFPG